LPVEQQRRSIASISLSECLQRAMKQTETVVEACTSGQSKTISFVIRGRNEQVTRAKRMIWSELAQNVRNSLFIGRKAFFFRVPLNSEFLKKLYASSSGLAAKFCNQSNTTWPSKFKFPRAPIGKAL
jgi:hypothetical protein